MDNAFQELDYSDISAKNINKKKYNDLNTKTRGGIIRLGSLIIILIVFLILIIGIISKSNTLSNLNNEINNMKEKITLQEREKSYIEEKNMFLANEIFEAKKNVEKLSNEKRGIEGSLEFYMSSNKKSRAEIQNAKDAISLLENKLKEFENKKNKIEELQKNTEYYQNEIEKLKNK